METIQNLATFVVVIGTIPMLAVVVVRSLLKS
jgi:hypothetical protein